MSREAARSNAIGLNNMSEINCKDCGLNCRIVYGASRVVNSAICPSCQKKFKLPVGPVIGVNWVNPEHKSVNGDEIVKQTKAASRIRRLPK